MSGLISLFVSTSVRAADVQSTADVTPDRVIRSLGDTFGAHPGQRKNHSKGTCAAGDFVATAEAARLSRSQLFSGLRVPAIVRFSVAGGNPNAADATKSARGMAIEFRLPKGSLQHMTMLNTPIFGAANPRTFNDMIVAARPDPQTGNRIQRTCGVSSRDGESRLTDSEMIAAPKDFLEQRLIERVSRGPAV
jgi:catalase